MPEPIQALVLRAWDQIVITCYWDKPTADNQPGWFVIKMLRGHDGTNAPTEKVIRLTIAEAEILARKIAEGPQVSNGNTNQTERT